MSEAIAEKMREGVEQGIFPGSVLLVSHRGRMVHHAAYGAARLLPEPGKSGVRVPFHMKTFGLNEEVDSDPTFLHIEAPPTSYNEVPL